MSKNLAACPERAQDNSLPDTQLSAVANSLCMELSQSGARRAEHIAKNASLIDRAAGLLAPLNGLERYLTLEKGHTAAFCKHAGIQGRTSQKSLQRSDSDNIDLQKLCTNSQFKVMIMEGWKWEVVSAIIDERYPKFATIAQKALNTNNHLATEIGELETCMQLAACADDPGMKDIEGWKDLATDSVTSLCMPCASYCKTLLEFVTTFGGGTGAPLICFMDAVAKQFGCTVSLGREYWEALTNSVFPSKTKLFPLIRVALALANMTGEKIEDGVARYLLKTDVSKLTAKTKLNAIEEAEGALQNAYDIAIGLGGVDVVLKPLGQLFVRIGLLVTNKGKQGRERTVYSLKQICSMYLADVGAIIGRRVTFTEWEGLSDDVAATPPLPAATAANTPRATIATLDDHKDPLWIAGNAGFSIGKIVVQKALEVTPERLYTVFAIGETVELQQVCNYSITPIKLSIPLHDLLALWAVSKTEPPMQMQGGERRPVSLAIDGKRSNWFGGQVHRLE